MRAGNKAGNIKEFYGDGSPPLGTGAVVGFAAVGYVKAGAGTGNLEVADCALGIDGREPGNFLLGYDDR
jgi:hypothetical protein